MTVTVIAPPLVEKDNTEVVRIDYQLGDLSLHVNEWSSGLNARAHFTKVVAFRVMDEGNLHRYWKARDAACGLGWVYEIHADGWIDSEEKQGDIITSRRGLREFLVAGEDDCVSVLATATPTIEVG